MDIKYTNPRCTQLTFTHPYDIPTQGNTTQTKAQNVPSALLGDFYLTTQCGHLSLQPVLGQDAQVNPTACQPRLSSPARLSPLPEQPVAVLTRQPEERQTTSQSLHLFLS